MAVKKILFICMGNICRSPSAEAVFGQLINERGLGHCYDLDSAGTHSYHVGAKPDQRSRQAARQRGIQMDHLRARQVVASDFQRFDHLIVMDEANRRELHRMFPGEDHSKVNSMMFYAPDAAHSEVPDPYYGGADGFDLVLDLLETASKGLLAHLETA